VKWKGPFWARRYSAIVVSAEEKAQVDRLRYILAHGVKENLVERVLDWPGVHAARSILEDVPFKGYWFDRTQEYAARNRGEEYGRLTHASEETFVLSRLPCWEHLSPEEYRKRVAELVEEIELDARVARMERGFPVLGIGAVLRQHPHTRPNKTKKSPAPRFHAASKAIRNGLREAYGLFLAAFRDAAELLKAGDRSARFPVGSFPPGLPFVRGLRHRYDGWIRPSVSSKLTTTSAVLGRGLPERAGRGWLREVFGDRTGSEGQNFAGNARRAPAGKPPI
jgi:hypothetical protein